jgi:hypothetical protein
MITYALWHGGSSYAVPTVPEDVEQFDSIKAATDAFWRYGDHDPYRPCVDSDAEMWLFFAFPDERDAYPDRIVKYGPRGGIVVERV